MALGKIYGFLWGVLQEATKDFTGGGEQMSEIDIAAAVSEAFRDGVRQGHDDVGRYIEELTNRISELEAEQEAVAREAWIAREKLFEWVVDGGKNEMAYLNFKQYWASRKGKEGEK